MPRASTTRSSARGATATKSRGRARAAVAEADEFVEVKGGDFAGSWNFEEQGDLIGVYEGSKEVGTKNGDRTLHTFDVDGEEITVWGTAILDSRLSDVEEGQRVKVVKTGDKITTKSGHKAWEFKVFVARGAIAR